MVYWEDDMERLKVEKGLRARRQEHRQFTSNNINYPDIDKLLEVIEKQTDLASKQNDQIDRLTVLLTKTLENRLNSNDTSLERVVYVQRGKSEVGTGIEQVDQPNSFEVPIIREDIDVKVIDKDGIEIGGGTVGDRQSVGKNIADKIAKIKKLKEQRGEQ